MKTNYTLYSLEYVENFDFKLHFVRQLITSNGNQIGNHTQIGIEIPKKSNGIPK